MACIVMACIVLACIVMTYIVMAAKKVLAPLCVYGLILSYGCEELVCNIAMAITIYTVMAAKKVLEYVVMAYVVMAYIVMAAKNVLDPICNYCLYSYGLYSYGGCEGGARLPRLRTCLHPHVETRARISACLHTRVHADASISALSRASLTACLLRGYGRASTQSDRLSEAVILSTGTPIPAQWT